MASPTIRIPGDGTERVGPSPRTVDAEAGSAARADGRGDAHADLARIDRARFLLEDPSARQAIQAFVHGSGELIRTDYAGARQFTTGFRLYYTYFWKSNLSDNNQRTELSFDFDDGMLERCNVGRDSSLLPAFYEAQLVVEIARQVVLDDRDVPQHPTLVSLIQRADAPQLMVLILNLRMASLVTSGQ